MRAVVACGRGRLRFATAGIYCPDNELRIVRRAMHIKCKRFAHYICEGIDEVRCFSCEFRRYVGGSAKAPFILNVWQIRAVGAPCRGRLFGFALRDCSALMRHAAIRSLAL